jgi:hypothetical protein
MHGVTGKLTINKRVPPHTHGRPRSWVLLTVIRGDLVSAIPGEVWACAGLCYPPSETLGEEAQGYSAFARPGCVCVHAVLR